MRPHRINLAIAALLLVFSSSACAGAGSGSRTDVTSEQNQSGHLSTVGAKDFDRSNFDDSTTVDNTWFPLEPGAYSVFEGSAIDDGERISRRVVTTVTALTKEIDGVHSVVIWERDYDDGRLVEAELGFFAQANAGNVWYFGEDTKEYENGEVVSTKGSWEAGAKPGIIMHADPEVGQSYRQEYYPGEAMDMARVLSLNTSVSVPYGSFDHALETREWTPLQPGFSEKKYYVRGVGPLGNPRDLALQDVKHK